MLHAVNPTSTRVARVFGVLVVAAVCLFSAIEGVQAQAFQTPTDTLNVTGRSSWEQGYLGFLNLNRDLTGARPTAMGGAGLAIEGGVEYMSVNPAGLLGMRRWELTSEMAIVSGGGSVKSFPARLDVGAGQPLETQNYRVSPNFSSGYRNLSLGLPLVVFGKRGAAALAYRRMSPTFQAEETRFEVVGPITNNIPATTGVGGTPDGSHDAISIGLARNMADWLDLGLAINFQSGELSNLTEIGASVFGQRVTGGGTSFQQDISSFNVDLGSKMHFGKLTLGASAFLGHTLEFKNGNATVFPLPTIQDPNAPIFRINVATLDHEMTVPTSIGLGMSYELSPRLLVAADYWIRPWSKSEITRPSLEPFLFFTDEADSSTFGYLLTQGSGDETFNAGLDDANSVRLGLEWLMLQRDNFEMPVRLGFRTETLAISNVEIADDFEYTGLVDSYWRYVVNDATPPDGVNPNVIEDTLRDVLEFQDLFFRGSGVDATAFTFGLGFHFGAFEIDLGAETVRYDIDKYFFQSFDPDFNPFAEKTRESRSLSNLSIATRLRF